MNERSGSDRIRLLPEPNVISNQFISTWNLVTPSVYRYEDEIWIDEFFETGKIRLSTFARFGTYPDEIRGDLHEGHAWCYGETRNEKSVVVEQTGGVNAVVLCCSHRLGHDLKAGFQRNSVFQITNTTAFAFHVSRQLAGFIQGYEGSCIYRSERTIRRSIEFNLAQYDLPEGGTDINMFHDVGSQLGGPELLLLKEKRYEPQQEYRLLWDLDSIDNDYVDVTVPQARQFCRRVHSDEWE